MTVTAFRPAAFRTGERRDCEFFRQHPDRHNHIRSIDQTELRQAICLHGKPPIGRNYMIVVRRIAPDLLHRRFLLNGPGDGSEECCRDAFDEALVAGEMPRCSADADPEPPRAA